MLDDLLVGWADLAAVLRHPIRVVMGWADPLGWDPIPVEAYADRVEIRRSRLETWRRRNLADGEGEERVFRMPAIARRAEMSVRAAFDASMAAVAPLPVQREEDGTIWAYASAIDDYRRARTFSLLARRLLGSKLVTARKVKGRKLRKSRRWPVTAKAPQQSETQRGRRPPESASARSEKKAARVPGSCQEGSKKPARAA